MGVLRMGAGGKGVQASDAVGKPMFDKEIEGTIGDGRLLSEPVLRQPVQNVVGAEGPVFREQYFQGPSPHWCKPGACLGADSLGLFQGGLGTSAMVMCMESGGGIEAHGLHTDAL